MQALNRLTFGLAKWIELQLHPDRIPENPMLEAKLKPLKTLTMALPEIVKEYTPQANSMMMMAPVVHINTLFSQEDLRKVQLGTAEERGRCDRGGPLLHWLDRPRH